MNGLVLEAEASPVLELQPLYESEPAPAVIWYPHWYESKAISVGSAARLATLIGSLPCDDWGGVRRSPTSTGPWVQVKNTGRRGLLIELHPRTHDREPGGMYFERVWERSATAAAALAWAWVRREELPRGHELEPRVVPPGKMFDVAL